MLRRSTALALLLTVGVLLVGSTVSPCGVQAQGTACADGCRAAYGNCYRATSNRSACEGQLQRCMQGCIASKRG